MKTKLSSLARQFASAMLVGLVPLYMVGCIAVYDPDKAPSKKTTSPTGTTAPADPNATYDKQKE